MDLSIENTWYEVSLAFDELAIRRRRRDMFCPGAWSIGVKGRARGKKIVRKELGEKY